MEIVDLTVENSFEILLNRLVDFSVITNGEIKFIFIDGVESKYDRLILNSLIIKPTLAEFETGLLAYKDELTIAKAAAEARAILDAEEAARIADWTARLDALPNLKETMVAYNEDQPNPATYKLKFIAEKALVDLEAFEALSLSLWDAYTADKVIKDAKLADLDAKVKDKTMKLEELLEYLELIGIL